MHKKRIPCRCLSAATVIVSTTWLAAAQQKLPESPLLRVQSEMVLVDMVVTDAEGNPVTDLRQEELQVLEDGKKQKVQFFDFLSGEGAASGERAAFQVAAPTAEASVILFLDMSTLEVDVFKRVQQSLKEFLAQPSEASPRIMLASFRNGLQIHRAFSGERAELLEALDSLEPVSEAESALTSFRYFYERMENAFRDAASDPFSIAASEGKIYARGVENQIDALCKSLSVLIRSVRAVPGRKQMLFLSAGYPLRPMNLVRQVIDRRSRGSGQAILSSLHKERMNAILSSSAGGNLHQYLREVIDQANRSQVSIYGIDARGLVAADVTGQARDWSVESRLNSDLTREVRDAVQREPQQFLTELATSTGGRAFLNSNNLLPGIEAAQNDARAYYLLAYRPDNKRKEGKFHSIEVKLQRPGASARYRQGYLETDTQTVASQDVMAALSVPVLYSDYPFEVQVEQQPGKITFNTIVPTQSLRFASDGKLLHASVAIYGILIDSKGKWVGDNIFFTRGQQLKSITEERKAKILSYATFSLAAEAEPPPPGEYQLVVVIRQGADGTLCAHQQTISLGG